MRYQSLTLMLAIALCTPCVAGQLDGLPIRDGLWIDSSQFPSCDSANVQNRFNFTLSDHGTSFVSSGAGGSEERCIVQNLGFYAALNNAGHQVFRAQFICAATASGRKAGQFVKDIVIIGESILLNGRIRNHCPVRQAVVAPPPPAPKPATVIAPLQPLPQPAPAPPQEANNQGHLTADVARNIGASLIAINLCDAYLKVINLPMLAFAARVVEQDESLKSAKIEGGKDFEKMFEFAPRMTCETLVTDMPAIWQSR